MTRFAQRYIINYGVPNLHSQIYGVRVAFVMFLKEMFADCNLTNSTGGQMLFDLFPALGGTRAHGHRPRRYSVDTSGAVLERLIYSSK